MPSICFKRRWNGRTVQLVRHCYDPTIQRSRTRTLGSLSVDADPENVLPGLRLRPGVVLSEDDHRAISEWLAREGDVQAAHRRQEAVERIEARVRAEVMAELQAKTQGMAGDALAEAVRALNEASLALPGLVQEVEGRGQEVWAALRPGYLAVHGACQRFLEVAQRVGVAKRVKRRGEL